MLRNQILSPAVKQARTVSAELIAAFWPGRDGEELSEQISAMPQRQQSFILGGVLGLLLLCFVFAAQFGLVGLSLLFMALIVLIG